MPDRPCPEDHAMCRTSAGSGCMSKRRQGLTGGLCRWQARMRMLRLGVHGQWDAQPLQILLLLHVTSGPDARSSSVGIWAAMRVQRMAGDPVCKAGVLAAL